MKQSTKLQIYLFSLITCCLAIVFIGLLTITEIWLTIFFIIYTPVFSILTALHLKTIVQEIHEAKEKELIEYQKQDIKEFDSL